MKKSVNLSDIVEKSFLKVMNDEKFIADFPVIPVVSNVSKQGELEFERRILKKIHMNFVENLGSVNVGTGLLTSGNLKNVEGQLTSRIVIETELENTFEHLGKISYKIEDVDQPEGGLQLIVQIKMKDKPRKIFTYSFSELLPYLAVAPNPTPLENIYDPEPLLVLIDFEWINGFKIDSSSKYASPEQVTEYAMFAEDWAYESGFLKVDENIVRHIHRKLMEKQGLTKDILLKRHKDGPTMYQEFEEQIMPLWVQSQNEGKPLIFLYFGREDGEILRQLFTQEQQKSIGFIDFTSTYAISQLGQEAILKGLGAEFTHTFSSSMDVKALHLIAEVFRLPKTVEESRNLQNAISVHKMMGETENVTRLEKYQKMVMSVESTRTLYEAAANLVADYIDSGYFDESEEEKSWIVGQV